MSRSHIHRGVSRTPERAHAGGAGGERVRQSGAKPEPMHSVHAPQGRRGVRARRACGLGARLRERLGARMPIVRLLLAALVLAGVLPHATRAARAPEPGALTIGVLHLPGSLNPLIDASIATADITDAIFDPLLGADTHDALQPDLATGYTIEDRGRRYVFHLNPRARWQDGVQVGAADVLYTAKLMRDPRFPAYSRFGFGSIATIAATGNLTVTVTLTAPFAPFLRAFATTPILPAHVLSPIPVAQVATYAAFNRRPIGSGPYMVSDMQDGRSVTLSASGGYFRGAPRIPSLVFRLEPSTAAALAALRAGTVDMLGPSAAISPQQLLTALAAGRLSAFASPGFGWTHIDLIESGFLRDHVVRQALAYATPRQRIVAELFNGLVTLADADQPPTSRYYEPAVAGSYPYTPERVATLLRSRGYKRVRGHNWYAKFNRVLRITLWLDDGCAECGRVAARVAASWTAAGIPTGVRAVATHALFGAHGPLYDPARLGSATLNAVLYTWVTLPEPDDTAYWSTSMIVRPGHTDGLNFDGYSNPQVDRLTAQALATAGEAGRIYEYRAIQRLLVRDQPDIFLYWTSHLSIASARLHGYEANPFHAGVTWNAAAWSLR